MYSDPDFRYVGESQKGNSHQLNAAQNVAFLSLMYYYFSLLSEPPLR